MRDNMQSANSTIKLNSTASSQERVTSVTEVVNKTSQ
jgi:hypothetical protein